MSDVFFYNTRTRQKEKFVPIYDHEARIYSCGPTVYHYAHIGNMRSFVFADILRRVMDLAGYKTTHVMNITDVGHLKSDADDGEDKMELGKTREGLTTAWDVAEKYTQAFFDHSKALKIKRPHVVCKATEHIDEQIDMVKTLEEKGYTYILEDGVYFDTSKFGAYGEMAKLDINGLESGARIDDNGKKNKTDFALWKFSPKDARRDMEWDSPWGTGFPGWHIECSAMAMKYLGDHFDIHTGGIDHIPVHHTNEIAQSECCSGKAPFVNFWLHNEFLQEDGGKMSKSKGDFLTVDSLIEKGYDPVVFRYLLLTSHYRNPIKFSWDNMDQAKTTLAKMAEQVAELKEKAQPSKVNTNPLLDEFKEALFDDLNTAKALAVLHNILKSGLADDEKVGLVLECDDILDIGLKDAKKTAIEISPEVQEIIDARQKARENKDWDAADECRDKLAAMGLAVKDTREGPQLIKL